MVYAGNVGEQNVSLGVSGRLDGDEHRNLIMWDAETNSLWNQITGQAIYGKSKGQVLHMLPAVFVGLGTWRDMHPKTLVLDMPTVRRKPWYFTTQDMLRGRTTGRRPQAIGIGVRGNGRALAISNDKIRSSGVVQTAVGVTPLAFVWIAKHSVPLVYDRRVDGKMRTFELKNGSIHIDGADRSGVKFDPLTGARTEGKGEALVRFPYIPTFMGAWKTYYPKSRVLE